MSFTIQFSFKLLCRTGAAAALILAAGAGDIAAESTAEAKDARAKILKEKYGLHEETIRTLEEINRAASGSSKTTGTTSKANPKAAAGTTSKTSTRKYTPRAEVKEPEKKKKKGFFSIFGKKKDDKPDYRQKAKEDAARLKKRREEQEAIRLKIEAERKAREARLTRSANAAAARKSTPTRTPTAVLPPKPVKPSTGQSIQPPARTVNNLGDPLLRVGLILEIAVYNHGEIEVKADQHRIAQNGSITLPLIGTTDASGITLEQLTKRLTEKYRSFLKNPQVSADFVVDQSDVTTMPWGFITVLGRVEKPGRIQLPVSRSIPLSTAIQAAGGFSSSAKTKSIKITRKRPGGASDEFTKNLKNLGEDGSIDDMDLIPNDVVYVPERIF